MAAAAPLDNAATAAPAVDDFFPFAALPPDLAHKIFAAVPVDTRLRCAEVCKAWCAAVAERSLWTRLHLSATSGVTHAVTPALLRAAAAKACGALTAVDMTGVWLPLYDDGALRDVLAANADTLHELRCLRGPTFMSVPQLEALLSAAPQLRVCETDVVIYDAAEARRAFRNEGVFGPLRMQSAWLHLHDADAATLVPLFAALAAHASLVKLVLYGAHFHVPAVLGAFVDAALSLPLLRAVTFSGCRLVPASVPALARLLSSGTLSELSLHNTALALLDAPAALLLGDALRANTTLTSLTLNYARLWNDRAAAAALLSALTGHASLRQLGATGERHLWQEDMLHAGALFGALIAADAPALTALDVSNSFLYDAGMRPLFEALPGNSHLRELNCSLNDITNAFAADVLLPAVRANTSLRTLITHADEPPSDAAREAEALVAERN
jgi:hypothetical protein